MTAMQAQEVAIFALSVATAGLVFLSAFVVIPRCSASVLRHWLWNLHDEVLGAVRSGEVQNDEDVRRFLRRLHVMIAEARRFTMLDVAVTYMATRSVRGSLANHLDEVQQPRLMEWERRFARRTLVHCMVGSPSGWVLTPVLAVVISLWALLRTAQTHRPTRQGVEGRLIRLEVAEMPPVLAAHASRTSRHEAEVRHACLI